MKQKGIIGIYLAAGKSERFGKNKLLQLVGDETLGSLAFMTALDSDLDKIVVVSQSDVRDWMPSKLFNTYQKRWFQVVCPMSSFGQSYSLKCGLQLAKELHAEAIIVMLADQPFISKEMINRLIRQYQQKQKDQTPISFIASTHLGIVRPPVLLTDNLFGDLEHLEGDKGARYIIQRKKSEGCLIEFSNPALFFDVDTEEDYQTLLRRINPTFTLIK